MKKLLIIVSVICSFVFISCTESELSSDIAGTWTAKEIVAVRYTTGFMSYKFVKDTVDMMVTITPDGLVKGTIGGATLTDCSVSRNRGRIGRFFNFATDYIIRGKLTGKIFEADTIAIKEISAPFNLSGKFSTEGSLFQLEGHDAFPMADWALKKE